MVRGDLNELHDEIPLLLRNVFLVRLTKSQVQTKLMIARSQKENDKDIPFNRVTDEQPSNDFDEKVSSRNVDDKQSTKVFDAKKKFQKLDLVSNDFTEKLLSNEVDANQFINDGGV